MITSKVVLPQDPRAAKYILELIADLADRYGAVPHYGQPDAWPMGWIFTYKRRVAEISYAGFHMDGDPAGIIEARFLEYVFDPITRKDLVLPIHPYPSHGPWPLWAEPRPLDLQLHAENRLRLINHFTRPSARADKHS